MWKEYKDYNIEVSEKGQVRNATTKRLRILTELKGRKQKWYYVICVNYKGKQKTLYVHRLVAELFLDNPKNFPCVNHIDNNKQNNNVSNLEWCSFQHNISSAFHDQNAFKTYKCKCCGNTFFQMGRQNTPPNICYPCYKKNKDKETTSKKRLKTLEKRKQFLSNIINSNYLLLDYYQKHKSIVNQWVNGETCTSIAKTQNCSKQNISSILNNIKGLYYSFYPNSGIVA